MKPTLIFDYDGTLHQTMAIYEPAFRRCHQWLVESGYAPEQKIGAGQIAGWLGMNSREMWNAFLPELGEELREEASRRVGEAMVEQIRNHCAIWYPGAEKALDELKADDYVMVMVSNCKIAYREANWQVFGLGKWFSAFYDCETFGFAPKTEIIREVQKTYPGPFIVIGDRRGDLECARACGSLFIGCRYGYGGRGELEGAAGFADSAGQLPGEVRRLAQGEQAAGEK